MKTKTKKTPKRKPAGRTGAVAGTPGSASEKIIGTGFYRAAMPGGFDRSEWLDFLMAFREGRVTLIRGLEIIEREIDMQRPQVKSGAVNAAFHRIIWLQKTWIDQAANLRKQGARTLKDAGISKAIRDYAVARYEDSADEVERAIRGEPNAEVIDGLMAGVARRYLVTRKYPKVSPAIRRMAESVNSPNTQAQERTATDDK